MFSPRDEFPGSLRQETPLRASWGAFLSGERLDLAVFRLPGAEADPIGPMGEGCWAHENSPFQGDYLT